MRVLIDTNVILDILLKREPFYSASSQLFELIDEGDFEAFCTASSVTDLYYISRKEVGRDTAKLMLKDLINAVPVLSVDQSIVWDALESDLKDFEDAIQGFSSLHHGLDCIITRNEKDFIGIDILVWSPEKMLEKLGK